MSMYLNRFFHFILSPIKLVSLFFMLAANVYAQEPSELIKVSNQIQQLLKVNDEGVNADTVEVLANEVLSNHQLYSNDTIAKVLLLSANVASNQGDINKVSLFAKQGLAANSRDKKVNLSLQLKLAEVHLIKKQYKQLFQLTQTAVALSKVSHSDKYHLLSLSYRSVALAMLGHHQQALDDLLQVEQGISKSELTEHIELLTILSLAYHRFDDYKTSLTMQLKILKLRFEMQQTGNIDQTYLSLGYAYFYLLRFDDAYNAFWESRKNAERKNAPISVAYANKGLGITLLMQQNFSAAIAPLEQAIIVFKKNEMFTEQIESAVGLAKAKLGVQKTTEAYELLNQVVKLLGDKEISKEFTGFYRMVAEMYLVQEDYRSAYLWQEKHSKVLITKLINKKKTSGVVNRLSHLTIDKEFRGEPINESRKLAIKLAEKSELSSSFVRKFERQRLVIISLSALAVILLITLVGFFFRLRLQRINQAFEEIEKPSYFMASPMETKFHYKLAFKKARKYQYPLAVGYLIIENWSELDFHFNNKSINEVTKDIASVINEELTEFDYVGLLNEGEYLLLFEHQDVDEASAKLDKLVQAVNARSFATLGDFSVTMKYSLNKPDFKDIDPYLFLARIAESVNIKRASQSQVSIPQVNEVKVS